MRPGVILALVAFLGAATSEARAPEISLPDDAALTAEKIEEAALFPLPVRSFSLSDPTILLEGRVVYRAWRMPDEGRSVNSVISEMRERILAQGFEPILDCRGDDCGGFDFRFNAKLLPPPDMSMSVRDFAQLTIGRTSPSAYASILASRTRGSIFVQVVTVEPKDEGLELVAPSLTPKPKTEELSGHDEGAEPEQPGQATAEEGGTPAAPVTAEDDPDPSASSGVNVSPEDPAPPATAEVPAEDPDAAGDPDNDGGTVIEGAPGPDKPEESRAASDAEAEPVADAPPETAGADEMEIPVPAKRGEPTIRPGIADLERLDDEEDGSEPAAEAAPAKEKASPTEESSDEEGAGERRGKVEADSDATDPTDLLDRLTTRGHVSVAGLTFDPGGTTLSADSNAALDRIARILEENPDLSVAIVGHSDNRGSLESNLRVSESRAKSVLEALVARGIDAERLQARGVGWLSPRRSNATEEGRAMNRRVELVLR